MNLGILIKAWPRSLPPTIIPIGALHTRQGKPLPEVQSFIRIFETILYFLLNSFFLNFIIFFLQPFKTFTDEAKDGFIVFTLGSFVKVSSMPKETLDIFLEVMRTIPQRIVWKWEGQPLKNLPPNVLMIDWLPQQDLLGRVSKNKLLSNLPFYHLT